MSARGVTIIGASAGSGKTYRLTQEVTNAIDPKAASPVPLEGLFAVTYTKKAHAELAARIHHKLVSSDAFTEAMRLPLAYVGTVHAACLRLLQEFALDAGLSPTVDVVAEDQAKLLRESLESALSQEHREAIDHLAMRFRLRWNGPLRRYDWLEPVSDIMELARANRIAPSALGAMATRSADGLLRLLSAPTDNGERLDAELASELSSAATLLARQNDGTGTTAKAIEVVEEAIKLSADGELDWSDWAKLSTIATGKHSSNAVLRLREAASRYSSHPRLHSELRELIVALYEAARIGLSAYQGWKRERRVLDYVDMLDSALELLAQPRIRAELEQRLRLVVVDEFQDTSPIQLALFVELHRLAKQSIWVGDRKQCIFEYAGADPLLMDGAMTWVKRAGGERDSLAVNYRSRPELVQACSELFARALDRHGFARDEVVVSPHRRPLAEHEGLPPFGLWCLETKKKEDDAEAIADGVRRMLAEPSATPVLDRSMGNTRDVRAGDIAVLVATNSEAKAIANALHARGVRVAIARAGLLKTPEGTLIDAALRWLLDESDSLASATIDALTGVLTDDPDGWLSAKLTQPEGSATPAWREPLARVRANLPMLAPSEAVDAVMAALDVIIFAARWPDPAQRVANLDAVRALASIYERRCAQDREASTIAGLLRYFDDMGTERLRRDEVLASDDQHVPTDDQSVIVTTYHRAKGLEWPVVVMASLDRGERRDAFAVSPEAEEGAAFAPDRPLAGRWIRYWPWPFGQLKKLPLADDAAQSPEGARIAVREDKERARLLYVGFTRARDHLVLAIRALHGNPKTAWLDALHLPDGTPLVELCAQASDGSTESIGIRGPGEKLDVATRVWRLTPERRARVAIDEARQWFARAGERVQTRPAYRITPSRARQDWPELVLPTMGEVCTLGGAMPVDDKVAEYDVLGDTVHAFLAADTPDLSAEQRMKRAQRLIVGAGLVGVVRPESLVGAGDRLRAFIDARWPGATWLREVPIDAVIETAAGERRIGGTIDLLLETNEGAVVFDHKTFPGATESAWRKKALEFLPQMAVYLEGLRRTRPGKQLGCWLHFPVGGGLIEVLTSDRSIPNETGEAFGRG